MITARYRSGNNLGGKQEAGQVLQIDSNRWRCAAKRKKKHFSGQRALGRRFSVIDISMD